MTVKSRWIVLALFLATALALLPYGRALANFSDIYTPGAGITGTPHDFRGYTGVSTSGGSTAATISTTAADSQICVYCHVPHNASTSVRPLWNHALDATTVWEAGTNYWATSYNETGLSAPSGVSLQCLSCHDGVIAIDAYGGATGGVFMPTAEPANLTTDLKNDHPVSVTYPNANLPSGSKFNANPTGVKVSFGGTLKVECASCHDPHNSVVATTGAGIGKFLRVKKEGSSICLACHNK